MRIIFAAEILVIRRAIEDNPELYLDELQAWLEYHTGEVFVRQMGLTAKVLKARNQQSNVRSSLRNERKRAELRRFTAQFQPEQFLRAQS